MLWPTLKFRSGSRRCASRGLYSAAAVRRLRIEPLEDRRLLSAGFPALDGPALNGPAGLNPVGGADSFAVVMLPDTQFYSQSYPAQFTAQTEWIVDHIAENNLAFVSHVGDVVLSSSSELEWTRADVSIDTLDGDLLANPDGLIPYSVLPGNHDIGNSHEQPARFIEFFGSSRYDGRSWYGGDSPDQTSQYQTFSADGWNFLHIGLEWSPRESAITWAQGVIDANPDLPVILSTHLYLDSGDRSADGNKIFERLVEPNPQVFMVLGGHSVSEYHQISDNDAGLQWFSRDFAHIDWKGTGDATIVITETDSATPDYVEIQNVSGSYVNTSGWVVAVNMGTGGDIDAVHGTYWHLPERMAPNEILYQTDDPVDNYFGVGILWSTVQTGWAMILDTQGQVVDFLPWNYSVSQIAEMDTTVNGFPVTGQGLWAGDTTPRATNIPMTTAQRVGNADQDTAEDFVFTAYDPASRGAPNPGLNTPFGPAADQIVRTGVGFSADPADFGAAIRTDLHEDMLGVNASVWMRIPFQLDDPAALIGLTLRMQYSDGFVAYLNGQEIARRNAPESPQWNSTATATRTVEESLDWETFDMSRHIDELLPGTNTLAIQGLNANIDDGDFLIVPRLTAAVARNAKATEPTVETADLDWLYEFEQISTKNTRQNRSSVEEAVDRLLATGLV